MARPTNMHYKRLRQVIIFMPYVEKLILSGSTKAYNKQCPKDFEALFDSGA